MSIMDFFNMFPDDESCLTHIFEVRFGQDYCCPKCEKSAKWYRIKAERAYSCGNCGHHLHPTVNTPFEKSRTSLRLWFYAIYLFTTSRHGVSAKELERQLGVTYKTAWRMGHEIRKHMSEVDGDPVLGGIVEIDETLVGGKRPGKRGRGAAGKTIVMGMLERDGQIVTEVVPDVKASTLMPHIEDHVEEGAEIHTDELRSYSGLTDEGYDHKKINHGRKEYAKGGVHVNGCESFWSHFKNAVRGTHIHVSEKHLWKYAKEFEFRFNNREIPREMFPKLVNQFLGEKDLPSSEEP
ncbi:MAG: IS1595 family transposase [Verrucomicrobiales bacterium]|nr:IS1595 family transposase [Verrucomicrobiales bacterium]